VTTLEDRLRGELRAESELITPDSIVPLRLPSRAGPGPGAPRRRGRRQWPGWAKPLAAAAAAAAVIGGTFAAGGLVFGGSRPQSPAPAYTSAPAYYAYTVEGSIYSYTSHGTQYGESVLGRYVKVRDTATGKLLATIRPPDSYNEFTTIAAAANGQTYVLGAMRHFERTANAGPTVLQRGPRTPMKFLEVHVSGGGQVRLSGLSLPFTVLPDQQPSIALSPDGSRLAVAYGGGGQDAVVQVVALGTGQARRWTSRAVYWTPLLGGNGAWTANGRTLMVQQWYVVRTGLPQAAQPYRRPTTTQLRLLDTAAPGASLTGARLLTLRPPAGDHPPFSPFITPDGSTVLAPVGHGEGLPLGREHLGGALAEYSARTGRLLRVAAPWTWHQPGPPGRSGHPQQAVAWSDPLGSRLVLLQPRQDADVLGTLTGGTFAPDGGTVMPQQRAGYLELESALRTAAQLAW